MICGDSQRDLVKVVTKKIETLKPQSFFEEQSIFLIVRGAGAREQESWWDSLW